MFNVFTSVTPLFIYLKILAIFLPSFIAPVRNGQMQVKIYDKIWFFVVVLSLVVLLGVNLRKTTHYYVTSSIILVTAWETCAVIGLAATLIVLAYQYFYATQIARTLELLHEFDGKVNLKINKKITHFIEFFRANLHAVFLILTKRREGCCFIYQYLSE